MGCAGRDSAEAKTAWKVTLLRRLQEAEQRHAPGLLSSPPYRRLYAHTAKRENNFYIGL